MQIVPKIVKIMLLVLLGFQFQLSKAQEVSLSNVPDQRLYEAFGNERIDFLVQNNPDLIGYYNFFLDNAIKLIKYPESKIPGIVRDVNMLELKNPAFVLDKVDMNVGTKGVNIFKYKFQIDQENATKYRLDDSGILIVIYPASVITEKYNKARNL